MNPATTHHHEILQGNVKRLRARVRGHSLDVLDAVQLPEGGVVTIALEELLSTPRHRPQRVNVWNDARLLGPFPLTRRDIYEDLITFDDKIFSRVPGLTVVRPG